MRLNVRKIMNTPGERIDFHFSMDLSRVDFGGVYPAVRPVLVEGSVRNTAGVLSLAMRMTTTLRSVCDRCGKVFDNPKELSYETLLADELENGENDEILLLEDDEVDLDELARSEFILGMDTKTLCSEDCKGLCPRCGADLNLGPCGCKKELDPRWAALSQLLEE
ncbi:MAG: YceD family protein [Oscillospiraceae bacterium]